MITYKDVESKSMTPEKKKEACDDWFSFYVGRKLTYLMTIPLLYTSITPNAVTWCSIAALMVSFCVLFAASNTVLAVLGWFLFFLWSLLDGVDGNIARYKRQFSKVGDLCDTMGGYLAIAIAYLGFSITAFRMDGILRTVLHLEIKPYMYIVLGALSSIFGLFPRLILHKALSSGVMKEKNAVKGIQENHKKSIIKLLALNISSISGGVMVISFFCCIFHALDLFTVFYCLINLLKMLAALYTIFNNVKKEGH